MTSKRRPAQRIILDANDQIDYAQLSEETQEIAALALKDFNTHHDAGQALEHAVEAINRLCRLMEILERRTSPT